MATLQALTAKQERTLDAKLALEMNLHLMIKNLEISLEEMKDPMTFPKLTPLGGPGFLGSTLCMYNEYNSAREEMLEEKDAEV